MNVIKLYVIDSSLFSLDDLSSIPLNEEEKEYVNKAFTDEKKKERILSKYLKDKYVGEYYLNEHKKPLSNKVKFNISHSKTHIFLGISEFEIGIDIEYIKPFKEQMKKYISSKEEYDYITNEETFYEIWTNKESLMKCKGIGIVKRLDSIPGLPINGERILDDEVYTSKTFKYKDLMLSITLKGKIDFKVEIEELTKIG